MNRHVPTLLSGLLLSAFLNPACRADDDTPSGPPPEVSESFALNVKSSCRL